MAKRKNSKSAKGSKGTKKEYCVGLIKTGEMLGDELIELLSEYGASFEGLVIETYALAKAWAALRVIAESEDYDAVDLFKKLIPSFMREMEKALQDIDN